MHRRTAIAALAGAASAPALALYDPPPGAALALASGAWAGTLTYRDWRQPDKLVTLRCRLYVALTGPDALALYHVFDDGPGKTVYSYEKMVFDFPAATLQWTSGISKPDTQAHRLGAVQAGADAASITFERAADGGGVDRHTLMLSRRNWKLEKTEFPVSGAPVFRNRYELVRSEA
jgi:hypothetical protein